MSSLVEGFGRERCGGRDGRHTVEQLCSGCSRRSFFGDFAVHQPPVSVRGVRRFYTLIGHHDVNGKNAKRYFLESTWSSPWSRKPDRLAWLAQTREWTSWSHEGLGRSSGSPNVATWTTQSATFATRQRYAPPQVPRMPGRARNSSHEQVSHPPHRYCQAMSCDTTGQQAASCKAHSSPTGHLLDLGRCAELVGSWLPPVQTVSYGLRRTAASAHAGGPPDRDQQQRRMGRCWPARREHFAAFLHAVELVRLSSTCHFSLLLAPFAQESVVFSSLARHAAIAAVGVAEDLQEQLVRAAGTRAARDLL